MVDFVYFLTGKLNKILMYHRDTLSQEDVAAILADCADEMLEYAAVGNVVDDSLSPQQLGKVLVALQWNINPTIRQAVRIRNRS